MKDFLFYLGLDIGFKLITGWTIKILWGWFIVTKFHLPPLTTSEATGICLIACLLTGQYNTAVEKDDYVAKLVVYNLIQLTTAFVLGAILHLSS